MPSILQWISPTCAPCIHGVVESISLKCGNHQWANDSQRWPRAVPFSDQVAPTQILGRQIRKRKEARDMLKSRFCWFKGERRLRLVWYSLSMEVCLSWLIFEKQIKPQTHRANFRLFFSHQLYHRYVTAHVVIISLYDFGSTWHKTG